MANPSTDNLWRIINNQDAGDIEYIKTMPFASVDELISVHYPAQLLRFAAEVVGTDNELARRLVARAMSLVSYECKRERLKKLLAIGDYYGLIQRNTNGLL